MLHSVNFSDYLLEVSSFDNDHEVIGFPLEPYSPFFPFSPSLEEFAYDDPLHSNFPDNQSKTISPQPTDPIPEEKSKSATSKRRYPRTDRHSKIRTLRGLRDRRMRLSVDVAGRFFALQDMLGFDRASSTIDWLLKQSRYAIEHRLGHFSKFIFEKEKGCLQPSPVKLGSVSRRESRNEARARARRRTMEKKKMVEDGEIGQHLDLIEHNIYHTDEKEISPARVEHSNCSSLIQGSKLFDESE